MLADIFGLDCPTIPAWFCLILRDVKRWKSANGRFLLCLKEKPDQNKQFLHAVTSLNQFYVVKTTYLPSSKKFELFFFTLQILEKWSFWWYPPFGCLNYPWSGFCFFSEQWNMQQAAQSYSKIVRYLPLKFYLIWLKHLRSYELFLRFCWGALNHSIWARDDTSYPEVDLILFPDWFGTKTRRMQSFSVGNVLYKFCPRPWPI